MMRRIFTGPWQNMLLQLLRLDTQSPLETGRVARIREAQELIASRALAAGFEVAHYAPPQASVLDDELVPLNVREAAAKIGPNFCSGQPNLVLRAGSPSPTAQTLVFNFHIDTVAGLWEPKLIGGRFVGRGAVDAKGPGIAVLAGVAHALNQAPGIFANMQVLIQSVAGEEGGAMGVYGTKTLIDQGFIGRLNIFAEPCGNIFFDSATSTMTARIEILGQSSTDDAPDQGDNATVILASICRNMALALAGFFQDGTSRMCVAGIHTGTMHNRVYGSGTLHLNFSYSGMEQAQQIQALVERSFHDALQAVSRELSEYPIFVRSSVNAAQISRLIWLKRGLPTLSNYDAALAQLLQKAGVDRCPRDRAGEAFTCDAIWAQRPGCYAVVLGPGNLVANHAHAEGEFISLNELEEFAHLVAAIVLRFGEHGKSCARGEH
jgi:acetylornithine deacetylase/succinyl-diaminopimelate desuccinylase-like protein